MNSHAAVGGWFAGNQAVRIASAKCGSGHALRCRSVTLDEQRREALAAYLIAEPVDEIFRGVLVRGIGLVAQQIAHGVVVLAVGEAAQFGVAGLCFGVSKRVFTIVQGGG